MTCRAPASPSACTGTPTGAQLSYDNEGRLSAWQNTPTSPTTTASYLYDGSGQRVQQAVTVNGSITTTTTYIAGGLEESVSNGTSTTLSKYFAAGGGSLPTMERVGTNGPLSVLASDGQGTVAESFDSAGTVTSAQLFTPYGVSRYSSGSSPSSHGYTGQVADSSTGLDYYHARYYDPVAGQFTSADTEADGLNRYGYVAGNPTTATDPSGHRRKCDDGDCGAPPAPPGPKPHKQKPPSCTNDANCGCYDKCGGSGKVSGNNAPYINMGDTPSQCQSRAHQPGWCSRFAFLPSIHDADYMYVVIGAGEVFSAQLVLFFVFALGQWFHAMEGVGGGLGKGFFSIPQGIILTIGYGALLTAGVPSGQQVVDFLGGISWGYNFDAIIGTGWVLSPGVGGWARQVEIGNQAGGSISGGYTEDPPGDPCVIQGPLPIRNPFCPLTS